jgi:RNA-directed DNA polymerase
MQCDEDCRTAGFGKTERPVGWEGDGELSRVKLVRHCEKGKPAGTDRLHLQALSHSFTLDLIAVHDDLNIIREVQELIEAQLKPMGLRLKPEKTRIAHTLKSEHGIPGFDFLGFNIRQYPVGKTHSGKTHQGKPLGFKTIIKPAKSSIRRQARRLRTEIAARRYAEQQVLIKTLMPVIVGWSRYYSTVVSKRTFNYLDMVLFSILLAWAFRRHTGKRKDWIIRKYWSQTAGKLWMFQTPGGKQQLPGHSQTPIRRHLKVMGNRSIYDGNWVYWSTRLGRRPDVPARVSKLLQKQGGTCWECGLYFRDGDLMEVDHVIPRALGGKDAFHNWQLLRFCGAFGEAVLKAHTSPVTATSKVFLSRFLSNVGGRYHSDQIECF